MSKILHLTDLHLVQGPLVPTLPHLPTPQARLAACVDHILEHHADADLCLLTGDLVQQGDVPSYRELKTQLDRLPMPPALLMGNHDGLPALREVFADAPRCPQLLAQGLDVLQYTVESLPTRIICLDTFDPERKAGADGNGGRLCPARLAWLDERLTEDARPTLLAFHHHPLPFGMPFMDDLFLEDQEALAAVLARHPQVRHLCFGHVHRPVSGQWAGRSFSTPGSVALPVALDGEHRTFIALSDEAPAYNVLQINDTVPAAWSLFVHRVPFMPAETWLLP